MRFYPFFLMVMLAACTFNSSDYDIKKLEINPEFALPLASGDLTIEDILEGTDSAYVHVYNDGLVYLSYSEELGSHDIRNLVDIPSLNLIRVLSLPAGVYPASGNDVNSTVSSTSVDMGMNPEKLTEISFKSGLLNYSMALNPNNPNVTFAVKVRIPEYVSKTTGNAFQQEIATSSGSFALSDYKFVSGNPNKFTLELTLVIKAHPNPFTVTPGSAINVNMNYAGVDFVYIKGFLGDQVANPPAQTLDIGTFGSYLEDNLVSFAQPKITLDVISEYGVPLEVSFTTFEAQKQLSSIPVTLNPSNPIPISKPANLGESAMTTVTVTNVNQVFNFGPSKFYYQVSGHINNGVAFNTGDFMADTSKVRVKMNVELPLYGKASDILLADTSDVNLGDLDQSEIQTAELLVSFNNKLPLDANLQIYLVDDLGIPSPLLESNQTNMVKGSTVDNNGEFVSAGVYEGTIPIDETKLNKIFSAKQIIIAATLNTSKNALGNYVDVKFKTGLDIVAVIRLKVKLKLSADL